MSEIITYKEIKWIILLKVTKPFSTQLINPRDISRNNEKRNNLVDSHKQGIN